MTYWFILDHMLVYPLITCWFILWSHTGISINQMLIYSLIICWFIHWSQASLSIDQMMVYPLIICWFIHCSHIGLSIDGPSYLEVWINYFICQWIILFMPTYPERVRRTRHTSLKTYKTRLLYCKIIIVLNHNWQRSFQLNRNWTLKHEYLNQICPNMFVYMRITHTSILKLNYTS